MEMHICTQPEKPDAPASTQTIWMAEKVIQTSISVLKPYATNNRVHTARSVSKLKASVALFGFVTPTLIDRAHIIIAGHGRYEASRALGLTSGPTVVADHLSPAEVRTLRIADNKLADLSDWNEAALRIEFADLMDLSFGGTLDFDLDITGFEVPEIDIIIDGSGEAGNAPSETVEGLDATKSAVMRPGDLRLLGGLRILCGKPLEETSYACVLEGDVARMVFTDPPYNARVQAHVRSGNGGDHRVFAMASGEMFRAEFCDLLKSVVDHLVVSLPKGAIAMVCMDWCHLKNLIGVGEICGLDLINVCVWNKTNGGMGSLYRSKHEMVCIFKKPGAPHINNVELGKHGRNRTNVWDCAGVNSFGKGREADLTDHPTAKPAALVADAILDVSHRGDVSLDAFCGSGATLMAAENTGRKARLIEFDPF